MCMPACACWSFVSIKIVIPMQVRLLALGIWLICMPDWQFEFNTPGLFVFAEPAAIVVRPPADFAAIAGQTVRLTCVAYGTPLPNITWTSSSQDIDLSDKVSYESVTVNETSFLVAVLQLCDITSANAAEYTCTASNGISGTGIASNSAKTFLSVTQPVTGEYICMNVMYSVCAKFVAFAIYIVASYIN